MWRKLLAGEIFDMDETSLFWKWLLERTFIHKEDRSEPGFRASEDKIRVLPGVNAACYRLKSFVIWRSENPRTFKQVSKHTRPVCYRGHKNSWMTQLLFQDALLSCYTSEMGYCLENIRPSQILPIVEKASRYPPFVGDFQPLIKEVFLPLSTASLIQPRDQRIKAAFKACSLRRTAAQTSAASEEDADAVLEGLQQPRLHREPCLGLW